MSYFIPLFDGRFEEGLLPLNALSEALDIRFTKFGLTVVLRGEDGRPHTYFAGARLGPHSLGSVATSTEDWHPLVIDSKCRELPVVEARAMLAGLMTPLKSKAPIPVETLCPNCRRLFSRIENCVEMSPELVAAGADLVDYLPGTEDLNYLWAV